MERLLEPALAAGAGRWAATAALAHSAGAAPRPTLLEEPRLRDPFREWRLLDPARYDAPGRVFVRWQIAATVVLPIWRLGGGAFVLFDR